MKSGVRVGGRVGLLLVFSIAGCSESVGLSSDGQVDLVIDEDHRLTSPDQHLPSPDLSPFADVHQLDGAPADVPPADVPPGDAVPKTTFVAVTFNTGASADISALAPISEQYYGHGLAATQAVATTSAFFAQVDADVVAFQEIFYAGDCPTIPSDAQKDFVCETWQPGDPETVALMVLGPGWQVACFPGKLDKCVAVNTRFGSFQNCATDYCPSGVVGFGIPGCSSGARVVRAVIDLVDGGTLTLVGVHGSSGIKSEDIDCRVKQVEQVFVDLGDGMPAANGTMNLIMGDFNTDPVRLALFDQSAAKWSSFVGAGKTFHFITDVGWSATPTYAGLLNIDHVVSDAYTGSCWTAGITPGHPYVIPPPYFDHNPAVCTIDIPTP